MSEVSKSQRTVVSAGKQLFRWFVVCSVGASRRCYLGVSGSHLLLSQSGSNWCDTAPTRVKPSVTDFTQV